MSHDRHDPPVGPHLETVRYRMTVAQRVVFPLVGVLCGLSAFQVLLWANGEPLFPQDSLHFSLVLLLLPLATLWGWRNFGVELTREAVILHGPHRRTIHWRSIQAIQVEGRSIALYETNGKRTLLRAPQGTFDRAFIEKSAVIEQMVAAELQQLNPKLQGDRLPLPAQVQERAQRPATEVCPEVVAAAHVRGTHSEIQAPNPDRRQGRSVPTLMHATGARLTSERRPTARPGIDPKR